MTERTCTIEGCDRKHRARGLCGTCYTREQKRGNLNSFPLLPIIRECTIEGCDRGAKANGWCNTHNERWRKHGTTDLHVTPRPTPAERLAAGLERKPNGCLEWTGSTPKGYGSIRVNGKSVRVHRLAWELANGPIPEGLEVRHYVCDNPPCCDVTHLRLGTHAENMDDLAGRKTHCPQNHPYDEANTYIDSIGRRRCKICMHEREHARRKRSTPAPREGSPSPASAPSTWPA